jgi:hypothetical protein
MTLTTAVKQSISIEPSLTGYISKGIALCGKELIWDAMKAFDLAFMFANEDPKIVHFLLLIKVRLFIAYILRASLRAAGHRYFQCRST